MFEQKPSGNFIPRKDEQTTFFSECNKFQDANGNFSFFPGFFGLSFVLIPISAMSRRTDYLSFVFPGMFSKVPIKASHIFFSMCITSRTCITGKNFQYSSWKNIEIFFQTGRLTSPFHRGWGCVLPNAWPRSYCTLRSTSSPLNGIGADSFSTVLSKAGFWLRYG